VASTTTIKALGTRSAFNDSAVLTALYTISTTTADPTDSPGQGTYITSQAVTLSTASAGATICYTTDGSTPTATAGTCLLGTTYTGAFTLSATATVNAVASKSGLTNSGLLTSVYTINVAVPTDSPGPGGYTNTQSVTLSDTTPSAVICYTTDGSTPAATSPGTCSTGTTYSVPFNITGTATLKAIGTKVGLTNSSVLSSTYTFTAGTPTDSPGGGSYSSAQSVTLTSVTSGAAICYTTDGSTPTATAGSCTHGTTYSGAISVTVTTTIKALASKSNYTNSGVLTSTYTISSPGGTFTFDQGVASDDGFTTGTAWTTCGAPGCTTGVNIATGQTVIVTAVFFLGCASVTATITDSQSNTYTQIGGALSGGTNTCKGMWYAKNITGDSNMIWTVTFNSSVPFRGISAMSLTPTAPSAVLIDQTVNGAIDTPSAPVTTGAFTTVAADEILVTGGVDMGTFTGLNNFNSQNFTIPAGCKSATGIISMGYQIVTAVQTAATVTITSQFSSSFPFAFGLSTFKD